MRFGIFADIHSNLEALQAVLQDMQSQGVQQPLCLGDVVGYNANPRECLELVQSLNCPVVLGNHDEAAAVEADPENFNKLALESIRHTKAELTAEQKRYLAQMPLAVDVEGLILVHSNQAQPAAWHYLFTPMDAVSSFQIQASQLAFFGHTHVPHMFVDDGVRVREFFYHKFTLHREERYFINVGSVGQPRDGDWRGAYVIYDSEESTIELRRVPYDVAGAQAKILRAGLPVRLAERLTKAN